MTRDADTMCNFPWDGRHGVDCNTLTAAIEARDAYWRDQIAAITAEDAGRAELWNRLDSVAKGLLDSGERIETTALRAERDAFKAALEVARVALDYVLNTKDGDVKMVEMVQAALSRISALVDPPGGKR